MRLKLLVAFFNINHCIFTNKNRWSRWCPKCRMAAPYYFFAAVSLQNLN